MKKFALKKELILFWSLFLISLFLLFFDRQGWLGWFRRKAERPVLAAEEKLQTFHISISQYFSIFSSQKRNQQELMRLQGQLRQMAFDQSQLDICLEENQRMKQLLGAPLPAKWKFLPAKVVGQVDGEMRLDKGSENGLKTGMMMVSENILVGKVTSVEENSSLVQLLFHPQTKIPVVVKKLASSGIQAKGLLFQEKGKLIVGQIIQSEDVRSGDLVLTAGEAGWLPDLLIGQIKEVSGEGAAIYKKAEISPLVDYQNLRIVFIVISY